MSADDSALRGQLVGQAAAMYRPAGRFAWHFARGKLSRDPLFVTLLRTAAIPDASCLVDLGCGQGLLAAWLSAARTHWTNGGWPEPWPAPPKVGTYLGIGPFAKRHRGGARCALPPFARVLVGDIRTLGATLLDRCDVATLFDVLQYLEPAEQEALLRAVQAGLPPWGVLLLRVGDGAAAGASRWANAVDLFVCAVRGHPQRRLHRRPIGDWTALLERLGFAVDMIDDERRAGKPFANVLLRASRTGPGSGPSASVR